MAISSYQGGHVEYFTYLVELLRERGAGHVKVYGGGGGVIVPDEIERLHERGVARIFSPEDGQRLGLPGMINMMIRDCDVDLAAQPPSSSDGVFTGEPATLARTLTLAEAGRLPDGPPARRLDARGPARPGAGHHRHRRLGQVVADRRARPPLPPRPGGQAPDRGARRRPDPPPGRRRAARRPDPDELARRAAGVLPLDGHPRDRGHAARAPRRRDRAAQGRRVRPGDRRDPRHRPGRRRDRRHSSTVAVRDDARVRRRVPAREDRHARLRRRRGDQQVRAPRRRGRPPRRRPPARAQPRRVRRLVGGHAGLRHQRRHLQRRRRHRALPPPALDCSRRTASRSARAADDPGQQDLHRLRRDHPAAAGALPGRDRRDRARLPRDDRVDGRRRAAAPAPAPGHRGARRPRRRRAAGRAAEAERALPARPRRCSTSGRRWSRPTPATRWSSTSATRSCARS